MTDLVNTAPILGGAFTIPEDDKLLHNQRLGLVSVIDDSRINKSFLYYLLNTKTYRGQVRGSASGATVRHTSPDRIKRCVVCIPDSIKEQARIAHILSAYDDLIENNRRRIQLLEQAARVLYKEWFLHLRYPRHEHCTIIDGVPEGWERRPLGDCAEFLSGGTPSKARADFWDGSVPWVSSGELTSMRIHRTTLNVTEDAVKAGSRLVPPETILAVVRGMSLAKEFRIGIAARPVAFNQDIKAMTSKPDVDPLYSFHAIDNQRDEI